MDIYHIWCDLKDTGEANRFARAVSAYLNHLKSRGLIEAWRLMRRKLGLAPDDSREFHIMIETRNLDQLDRAFQAAASRTGEVEALHHEVYMRATRVKFALYRDWLEESTPLGDQESP